MADERYTQEPHSPSQSEEGSLHHDIPISVSSQDPRANAKLGASPQRRHQRSDSDLKLAKAHLTGLLKHSVVYISPCLHLMPYLTEDLLPILSPEQTTTSLSHWSRDLLYLSSSAPVVGESQAYVGLQKLVLVETRRGRHTDKVIERLRELNLSVGEEVRVWDWRMSECLVELLRLEGLENTKSFPPNDDDGGSILDLGTQGFFELSEMEKSHGKKLLVKRLSNCYVGKLTMQDQEGKSQWWAADIRERDWTAKSLVQSLIPQSDD